MIKSNIIKGYTFPILKAQLKMVVKIIRKFHFICSKGDIINMTH
jgi:hypothetical protein